MKEIHIQWVPGYAKLQGNEYADKVARLATKVDQTLQPLDFFSILAAIKSCVTRTQSNTMDASSWMYTSVSKREKTGETRQNHTFPVWSKEGTGLTYEARDTELEFTTLTNANVEKKTINNLAFWNAP